MPWVIIHNDERFCVHKQNTDGSAGEQVACFDSEQGAEDHLAALYANVSDARKSLTAVKFLDEEGGRIGGYLVVWGSPAQRDLQGEYFTPQTELALDWYERRPVLYHHGLDGTLKANLIGVIETLKTDDVGLWAEAQLDMRQRYIQAVQRLVKRGILNWSSGSLTHLAEIAKDGQIKRWPIVEGSLTPAPAEPRQTNVRALKAVEGLDEVVNLEELEAKAALMPAADEPPQVEPPKEPVTQEEEEVTMELEQIVRALLAAMMQATGAQLSEEQQAQVIQAALAAVQQDAAATGEPAAMAVAPDQMNATAKAVAPKVKAALDALLAESEAAQAALAEAAKTAVAGMVGQGGRSRAPGFVSPVGTSGAKAAGSPPVITQRTKYHNLSAADMAFMHHILNPSGKRPWTPDVKFWRELADKAAKSLEGDSLNYLPTEDDDEPVSGPSAIKAIAAIKADELDYATQTGYGDEWVADLWRAELWTRVRRDNVVAAQFQIWDMPTNPWNVPLEGSDPTVYRAPETTDEAQLVLGGTNNPVTASKIGTAKRQLEAYKLALRVPISAELEEDAIIQAVPQAREQSVRAMQDAIDYVLLNADPTTGTSPSGNINKYDAAVAATDMDKWLLGWDGVLTLPLVDNDTLKLDAGNARPLLTMFRQVQAKLDEEYLDDTANLVWIVDPLTHQAMKDMDELLTVDKYGPNATILTGEVGKIDGIPVLSSVQLKRGAANGKISTTSSNNTRGRAVLIYRPYFTVGYRRRIRSWVKFYEEADAYQMGVNLRIAFKRREETGAAAGLLYNLAV